jgi:hypothetical protein
MNGYHPPQKPRRARRLILTRKNLRALCGFAVEVSLCLGCGYAPVRRAGAPGLRVAEVKNDTAQAEAGGVFAAELRGELAGRGRLESDASTAPSLAAELVSLRSLPTVAGTEGAAAYQLIGVLLVSAGDYRDSVTGGEDYLAGVDVLGTEANRRAALRRLARTMAHDAVEHYDVAQRMPR